MRKYLHIILFVAVAVVSCRGPRVIPKDEMSAIYYDMFLTDQQVREEPLLLRQADTMLVYEAVFNRYGYDTDDYLYSVRHYLKDPERFAKMVEEVADRLKGDAEALDKVIGHLDWVNKYMGMRRPPVDSLLWMFCDDSVYVGLSRVAPDSSRYGGWFRLVPARVDTLMVPVDSLAMEAKDSLSVDEPVPPKVVSPVEKKPAIDRPVRGKPLGTTVRENVIVQEEIAIEEEAL